MSKPAKNPTALGKKAEDPSFEEALKKLESITEAMESDELPLEDLLQHYEAGMQLAGICSQKLAEAETKIKQLEKSGADQFGLKPVFIDDDPIES